MQEGRHRRVLSQSLCVFLVRAFSRGGEPSPVYSAGLGRRSRAETLPGGEKATTFRGGIAASLLLVRYLVAPTRCGALASRGLFNERPPGRESSTTFAVSLLLPQRAFLELLSQKSLPSGQPKPARTHRSSQTCDSPFTLPIDYSISRDRLVGPGEFPRPSRSAPSLPLRG